MNVWSPSLQVEKLNLAWSESIPLNYVSWGQHQTLANTAYFLWSLVRATLSPAEANVFFKVLVETRYEPLVLLARKIVSRNPPKPRKDHKHTSEKEKGDDADNDPLRLSLPATMQGKIDGNSPEAKEYMEYQQEMKAPFLDLRANDPMFMHVIFGDEELDPKDRLYNEFKGKFSSACRDTPLSTFANAQQLKEIDEGAKRIAKVFLDAGATRGMLEIYLGHYIEDLLVQLVGESQVYAYIKFCLVRDPAKRKAENSKPATRNQARDLWLNSHAYWLLLLLLLISCWLVVDCWLLIVGC